MLRASKDGTQLEVVGVNNDHNHDCSNIVNKNLPHQRKLPEDIKQEVVEMMLLHIDRKKIIEYVKKKTNKSITVKDLFNLKAKYKNFNFKLDRSKDEILQSMGLSKCLALTFYSNEAKLFWKMHFSGPSNDVRYENDGTMEDESKEWMGVCYDENVIEYDEYSDYQDDGNVEIDVEVHSGSMLEYAEVCEETQYETIDDPSDLHGYQLNEEHEVYSITADEEPNMVTKYETNAETLQQNLEDSSDQEQVNQKLRKLRLKCFIQRENNRLKKKLLNCRLCGTNPRFLACQIRLLQAEKQKLMEETTILRLTKEKLLSQVAVVDGTCPLVE